MKQEKERKLLYTNLPQCIRQDACKTLRAGQKDKASLFTLSYASGIWHVWRILPVVTLVSTTQYFPSSLWWSTRPTLCGVHGPELVGFGRKCQSERKGETFRTLALLAQWNCSRMELGSQGFIYVILCECQKKL